MAVIVHILKHGAKKGHKKSAITLQRGGGSTRVHHFYFCLPRNATHLRFLRVSAAVAAAAAAEIEVDGEEDGKGDGEGSQRRRGNT